jgi:hypothetical protein
MADQGAGFAVLAQKDAGMQAGHSVVVEEGSGWGGSWAVWAFIWFIIIVAIVFFLIVAFGGDWFEEFSSSDRSGHGSKDRCHGNWWGRALLWAVAVALIILILFWLLACLGGSRRVHGC